MLDTEYLKLEILKLSVQSLISEHELMLKMEELYSSTVSDDTNTDISEDDFYDEIEEEVEDPEETEETLSSSEIDQITTSFGDDIIERARKFYQFILEP